MPAEDSASTPMIAGWLDPEVWSTDRVAPHKQFDRWREFVVEAHMHWAIDSRRYERFPAYIRLGKCGGYRMSHLTSRVGGIVGRRDASQIALDDEAFYNLIYVAEGSILLEIGREPVELRAGHFALWDTTRQMRFVTGENLRQVTLIVPRTALQRALPDAEDHVGQRMDVAQSDVGRFFIEHMLSLDRAFGALPEDAVPGLVEGTVALLATTLKSATGVIDRSASAALLRQVTAYIERHLDDPGLTAERIAHEHRISARHLNRVFHQCAQTPAAWIRRQRLERCRQDLLQSRQHITHIAYRWGFGDAASFSKAFKREYGVSPRAFRGEAGDG